MTAIAKTPQEISACTASQSALGAHSCNKVIPFYPLRYSVAPAAKGGFAYSHPNLEKGFPALDGYQYVLRSLRDDDGFLYIFDQDNREQIICFVYRSPDGDTNGGERRPAQFQRLQLDQKFNAIELVGSPLPFAYIPAYDHTPKKVVVWFADTLQSPDKLKAFKTNANRIRTELGTEIDLAPWIAAFKAKANPDTAPAVKHTLRMEDVVAQQAVGLDGKPVPWSEYPQGARFPPAAAVALAQGPGSARLAVALYDPIGLLSELGKRVGVALEEWNTYNEVSQRALWASKAADVLLDHAYSKAYNASYNGDIVVSAARGTGATGVPILRAADEAKRQGEIARKKRRDYLNDDLRQEFLENDKKARTRLLKNLNRNSEPSWIWWQHIGAGAWAPALALYDLTDSDNFCALRGAIARGVLALAYHEQGSTALANQLLPEGPTGVFYYAMLGYPGIDNYVDAARKVVPVAVDQVASAAMEHLEKLFQKVPPDAASQQLSQVVMALLGKKGLAGPERFPGSTYARMFEVMDGSGLGRVNVKPGALPDKLLKDMGIKGKKRFQRTRLSVAMEEAMAYYQAQAAKFEPHARREYVKGLGKRLSLWHDIKLGAGALGIWISTVNLANAVKKLGAKDGLTLANLLDAGSNAGVVVASGYAMQSAKLAVEAQRAVLAGNNQAAELARKAGEKADRLMIGWTSAAAFVGGMKALRDKGDQHGSVRTYMMIDAGVQFAEAGFGAAWLLSKNTLARQVGGRLLASLGRLRGGQVGLILFAVDIGHTLLNGYIEQAKAEQKVNDWLDQCFWGKHPKFDTDGEERRVFMQLSMEPRIETDLRMMERLSKIAIPGLGPILASRMPARTITVAFPGWLPQASEYKLTQHRDIKALGKEQEFGDPSQVKLVDGVGYLTFDTSTLMGATMVEYYPNAFSDPDLVFPVEK
ncbi:hypothetical protein WI99_32710 [Burkholderia cepacia]|uniref:toxin VasX n=1 Tax=Burkholderia cepacia TaxID=292 RepID=UPI00075C058E|nr:toxin VasX [Burkholderia cepacia]KVE78365.1 hypothetical protein WI99_32710 [Burkholderia cepacia]